MRRRAFYAGEQVSLAGSAGGCCKYRIIATDVTNDLRPVTSIQGKRDALGSANGCLDDQQVRSCRFEGSQ